MYLVRSDKHGAHNLLKPEVLLFRSEVKDILIVGIYQNRDETESLCRPDLYSSIGVKFLILMAWSQAPYIHVILADVVSIT